MSSFGSLTKEQEKLLKKILDNEGKMVEDDVEADCVGLVRNWHFNGSKILPGTNPLRLLTRGSQKGDVIKKTEKDFQFSYTINNFCNPERSFYNVKRLRDISVEKFSKSGDDFLVLLKNLHKRIVRRCSPGLSHEINSKTGYLEFDVTWNVFVLMAKHMAKVTPDFQRMNPSKTRFGVKKVNTVLYSACWSGKNDHKLPPLKSNYWYLLEDFDYFGSKCRILIYKFGWIFDRAVEVLSVYFSYRILKWTGKDWLTK